MKQVLNNMMARTRHQYLALRLEEQQIKQAEGSSPQLALPGLPDLEPATEQTLLALPAAPEGSLRRHSSPSQGGLVRCHDSYLAHTVNSLWCYAGYMAAACLTLV